MIPSLGRLFGSLQSCRCTAWATKVAPSLSESLERSAASLGFSLALGLEERKLHRLQGRRDRHQASSRHPGKQGFIRSAVSISSLSLFLIGLLLFRDSLRSFTAQHWDPRRLALPAMW